MTIKNEVQDDMTFTYPPKPDVSTMFIMSHANLNVIFVTDSDVDKSQLSKCAFFDNIDDAKAEIRKFTKNKPQIVVLKKEDAVISKGVVLMPEQTKVIDELGVSGHSNETIETVINTF